MLKKTNWFDRIFSPIQDNGLLPGVIERLDGTPIRLNDKVKRLKDVDKNPFVGGWSIKQEVAHLMLLETLWFTRLQQIAHGEEYLISADLSNRATHEADLSGISILELSEDFAQERYKMTDWLQNCTAPALNKTARHPRLGTPMRIIDLAYFVAEHDDHHLAQITFLSALHST
ncbi:MAG: DinB family protein [Bacteroidetes Order II. Incertae sedis bacterium]|nr:DinB family protein [Bacteroidetes Order II. bacterium]